MRQRGGDRLALGAADERVVELARAVHRGERNGAAVGAHEIHRAEVEADHARQRGDRPRVVHGAVRLDHHADRDLAAESAPRGFEREALEEALDVADRFRLGRGQERDAVAGVAEQNRELLDRARVVDVVDAALRRDRSGWRHWR